MRVWGRVYSSPTSWTWQAAQTDASGNNDMPAATWFIQCCKLNLLESPFFGQWGLAAQQSVVQQVAPDYYMSLMQQRFAPYFASLLIAKNSGSTPSYGITIITHQGVTLNANVPIPQ